MSGSYNDQFGEIFRLYYTVVGMLLPFNKSSLIQTAFISVICLKGRCQPSSENEVTGTHTQLNLFVHPAPWPLPQCCHLTLLLWTLVGTVLSWHVHGVLGISDI